jgi:hypothetical protein
MIFVSLSELCSQKYALYGFQLFVRYIVAKVLGISWQASLTKPFIQPLLGWQRLRELMVL